VLSLWKVDDNATALLLDRFYQILFGRRDGLDGPLSKAEALHEAKRWLRVLTAEQVDRGLAAISRGTIRTRPETPVAATEHSYEHPRYWAAFILIGNAR
jgi:CHAT domain-containing protein